MYKTFILDLVQNVCITALFLIIKLLNYNFFSLQGTNASALEKDIGPEQFPINEHYFGLVNVSSYYILTVSY